MRPEPFFIVIRGPSRGRGYPRGWIHKNTGAAQSWITGPGQTCRWYRYEADAQAAAKRFNNS